ncbi:hypothetical protein GGR54DRAFT_194991 [Hypoxylon sp. NC1633]|nr:hypothetical protein GGR54DRAFT_194991 [Hypoxylon sp. NC1633]
MADARALLRAHRAENRIKHPHAAYSDAGKLLCKLCHEPVKSEALWEGHMRSANHKKRLQAQPPPASTVDRSNGNSANKRKLDDVDETMSDVDEEDTEDAVRKKRSKTDVVPTSNGGAGGSSEKRQTPPVLGRRTSNTPVQGIEIAIPSRPATPAGGSNSATSTPKGAPVGRSPLIGSDTTATPPTKPAPAAQQQPTLPISTQALAVPNTTTTAATTTPLTQAPTASIDEAEWAAFEAEMAVAQQAQTHAPAPAAYSADATISAPAVSARDAAARSQEEEHERRKHAQDTRVADEREDAARALETEFEEMEELEGRVRRLKERREELRKGSVVNLRGAAANAYANANAAAVPVTNEDGDVVMAKGPPAAAATVAEGKENSGVGVDGDDDEDDDEEEEDDWDAFRFR